MRVQRVHCWGHLRGPVGHHRGQGSVGSGEGVHADGRYGALCVVSGGGPGTYVALGTSLHRSGLLSSPPQTGGSHGFLLQGPQDKGSERAW